MPPFLCPSAPPQVRIYFRDINAGLQKFTPLWNDWVDPETLPVRAAGRQDGWGGGGTCLKLDSLCAATRAAELPVPHESMGHSTAVHECMKGSHCSQKTGPS